MVTILFPWVKAAIILRLFVLVLMENALVIRVGGLLSMFVVL